ncbi:MAG TPA: NADH-quinone oxidoreductase subunit K [Thermoanaerobaculaceae bacterium]|nr:NADH-quinone oxidoreductase subunit K [Thermoanaerobaculaceae bacterium]
MTEPVAALFFTGLLLFMTGVYLLLGVRNLLRIVLAIEVLAKGTTLMLLGAGLFRGAMGLAQSLIVTFIVVETILAAVMLALVVVCQRTNSSLDIRLLSRLKG